jgi:hypothetical protein
MKFAYWSREVAGWALIVIGLVMFGMTYLMLLDKRVFQAGPMVFMGFITFRGGIHVLKVAVAAQAARNLPDTTPTGRRTARLPTRPIGPTPAKSVLPGPKARRAAATGRD